VYPSVLSLTYAVQDLTPELAGHWAAAEHLEVGSGEAQDDPAIMPPCRSAPAIMLEP
jgi:hypothetical protein